MTDPSSALPFARPALLELAEGAGSGRMLPAPAYLDEKVLDFERRQLFAGGWLPAGRCADIAEPGTQRAVRVGDDSVLLVRGRDGVLRGFFNVCQHRGHELLPCGATTTGRFIPCPYHAWTFDLDGRLHAVPAQHRDDVDLSAGDDVALALVPARVEEWQGFVLVNASGDAPPLATYLAGLDELLAPYELDRVRVGASHPYSLAANWKLAVENYHECFHCSGIHPELCRVSSPDSGTNLVGDGLWLGGSMWLEPHAETMSLDGSSGGVPFRLLDADQRRDVIYLQLFPGLLISLHPDYVMTHTLDPVAPGRTEVECAWLFPPEALQRPGFDPSYAVDFWDLTNRQDWAACESVQRGVASRGYRPGPFSSYHETIAKAGVALVARAYLDGGVPGPLTGSTSTTGGRPPTGEPARQPGGSE